MRILFLSHTPDTGPFRVGSHHLAPGMARQGHEVIHVGPPVTVGHLIRACWDPESRQRVALAVRGRFDDASVYHTASIALLPFGLAGTTPFAALNTQLCWMHLKRRLRKRGFARPDLVLIDQPPYRVFLSRLGARTRVFRATDIYVTDTTVGRAAAVLREAVDQMTRDVDAVIATSQEALDAIPTHGKRLPTLVVNNGVEFERFASVISEHREGAIYVGAIDDRFDWPSVITMAQSAPQVPINLAGPVFTPPPVPLPPNVHLLGPIPYPLVPKVLAGAKVGLLPFTDDVRNHGRSPMKYFEYLAAGLFVVGRATRALEPLAAPGVYLYDSDAETVDCFRAALAQDPPNGDGAENAKLRDWDDIAASILSFVTMSVPDP